MQDETDIKLTLRPPTDPRTLEEWQNAVDASDAMLKLDAARMYGLVRGGPEVDVDRCWDLIHRAAANHRIEPADDAVERFLGELLGGE